MRLLVFLLLSFTFLNVSAGQWYIEKIKDTFQLSISKNSKSHSYFVASEGGTPKFVEEKSLNEKYLQVIYFAGTAGSSQPIDIYRSLVLDKTTMKLVKDLPYKYEPSKGTTYKPTQPVWKIEKSKLTVTDKENASNFTISLK